jgi:hypothetical protein
LRSGCKNADASRIEQLSRKFHDKIRQTFCRDSQTSRLKYTIDIIYHAACSSGLTRITQEPPKSERPRVRLTLQLRRDLHTTPPAPCSCKVDLDLIQYTPQYVSLDDVCSDLEADSVRVEKGPNIKVLSRKINKKRLGAGEA